jgi:hypothetical protein
VDSNYARSAWASSANFGATTFTDVTSEAGIIDNPWINSFGITLADYDNDGDLDAYVANGFTSSPEANFLYRNNGDGTFTDVAESAGAADAQGCGLTVSSGDYDNDGNRDIFVGDNDQNGNSLHTLLHNNGDDTFTDVTSQARLDQRYDGGSVAWVDYDKDGWLDLYCAGRYRNTRRFYHNNRNGTFTEVTSSIGLQDGGCTVAFADINNDGYPDFYAGNESNPSLYLNNRGSNFTDIAVQAGLRLSGIPVWGDFNNDGYVDLFIASSQSASSALYRNNGDGTFTDVTKQAGVSNSLGGWFVSAALGDYNNDGYLDIYVMSNPSNLLYHNNGDGTFVEVASIVGVNQGGGGGAVFGDVDGDGDSDLFLSQRLFRNNGNANHWLQLKLVGTASNRSAIGARVKLTAGTLTQYREVSGGNGYSQNVFAVEFGLGPYTQADTIEICWPSGVVQTLRGVAADQVITVVEEAMPRNVAALSLDGNEDYVAVNDAATLDLNNSLTIEAWIKLNATSSFRGVVEKWNDDGSQRSYNFQVYDGILTFHASSVGDSWDMVTGSTLSVGQWYHVAVTYNGTDMQLYLNGVPDGNPAPHSGGILNSTARLTIGSKDNSGDWFDGLIDEVRIFDYVRTQEEIQSTMNQPLAGSEAGLAAYYRFDELENLGVGGDGLTDDVRDLSGNGNHGDLVGDATLVPATDLPLPIGLSAFSAISTDDAVTLKWRTETETNNLGFNLYRSDTKDGKYLKINVRLIAGAGTDATPHDYSFTDDTVVFGKTYYYYIENVDFTGKTNKSYIIEVTVGKKATVDKQAKSMLFTPPKFALLQNFPNPFNPETWIPYQLAKTVSVTIRIYDQKGRIIRTLDFGNQQAGSYVTKDKAACWDGKNEHGERVASGIYFYQLKAGNFSAVRKMMILK